MVDGLDLSDGFDVWVVQPVNVLTDALVYVLLSSQVTDLFTSNFTFVSYVMSFT